LKFLFEKILVALDGSEHSIRALKTAIQIAKKFDGTITLIHVYTVSPFVITPKQVYKYVQAVQELGNNILQEGTSLTKAEGVQVETLLTEGHAVEKILKTAMKQNFNLIVLGSRGLSTLKGILMGSVSEGVTKNASCPVLVVK
jgi:nucleotide-binding universal stress UspA family protein